MTTGTSSPAGPILSTGRVSVGFEHLDANRLLKPTSVTALLQPAVVDAFPRLVGATREEYADEHGLRTALTYQAVEREARSLQLDAELETRITTTFGRYAGRKGRPDRYGGWDEAELRDARGMPVVRCRTAWVWFRWRFPADPLATEPVPALRAAQDAVLPAVPERPRILVDAGPTARFRWSVRETDVNGHVFFRSYLERAENALADAGIDERSVQRWEMWFSRPALGGEQATVQLAADPSGSTVLLAAADSGEVHATLRATAR